MFEVVASSMMAQWAASPPPAKEEDTRDEYTFAIAIPRVKAKRGVLADIKSGAFIERSHEALEKSAEQAKDLVSAVHETAIHVVKETQEKTRLLIAGNVSHTSGTTTSVSTVSCSGGGTFASATSPLDDRLATTRLVEEEEEEDSPTSSSGGGGDTDDYDDVEAEVVRPKSRKKKRRSSDDHASTRRRTTTEPLWSLLERALRNEGLETVRQEKETHVILLVRAPMAVLKAAAEASGYACAIDKERLRGRAREAGAYFNGDPSAGSSKGTRIAGIGGGAWARLVAQFVATEHAGKGARNPYAFLHAPYARSLEPLLVKYEGGDTLSRLDEIKLTSRLISHIVLRDERVRQFWDDNDAEPGKPTLRNWTGVDSLLKDGDALAFFVLHVDRADGVTESTPTREELLETLVRFDDLTRNVVWSRGYERIVERDVHAYFGTAVAFYFCFLSHYTRWLKYLSVLGIVLAMSKRMSFVDVYRRELFVTSIIGALAVAWAFAMLRAWKDRQARLALRWGGFDLPTTSLSSTSRPLSATSDQHPSSSSLARAARRLVLLRRASNKMRAAFKGIKGAIDPVTGSTKVPYYPESKRRLKQRQNWAVVVVCVGAALFNVIMCKMLRVELVKRHLLALPATIMNAILVFVLNSLMLGIAKSLADRENHEFDYAYEASVFSYVTAFRLVNSFATLFYTAYLKRRLEGACDQNDDCFADAGHCAAVFFLVQLTIGNAMEVLPALLQRRTVLAEVEAKKKAAGVVATTVEDAEHLIVNVVERDLARAANQLELAEAPAIDVLDDYLEIVVQFGYVVLFFLAFPSAPVWALLNNVFEAKIDAIKRLAKRRPLPVETREITTYTHAFFGLAVAAIVNNCAMFCFLGDKEHKLHHHPDASSSASSTHTTMQVTVFATSPRDRFFTSVALLFAVAYFVYTGGHNPKYPYDVSLQLKRQAYVLSRESHLLPELHGDS